MAIEINTDSRGFTLIEMLIVTAILGLVVMSMFGLYRSTQRQAFTQEEVVDVQQNLRVAMDQIVRDLRTAGFMVPTTTAPIGTATMNSLTMNTASTFGQMARIDADTAIPSTPPATYNVVVGTADMADIFGSGHKVRVIRPPNQSDVFGREVEVAGKSRTTPSIRLDLDAGDADLEIKKGDIIARVESGSGYPGTIQYALNGSTLERAVNGGTPVALADKIYEIEFGYLLDDDNTHYNSVASGDLEEIRAVEITLRGATTDTASDQYGTGGARSRELKNVVTIRNR